MCTDTCREGAKTNRARLFSVVLSNRNRDTGSKLKHVDCGHDLELAWVAQGGSGVSIL